MNQTNWEAISAIAQMIGSIAVVLSVLYLAMQVHQSTRIAKLAAQDAAATSLREVTRPFAENADLARVWRRGLQDLQSLPAEEQARFFHSCYQFLKAFETIHFHHIHGVMDEQIWQGWCGLLRHYIASPGMEHYWKLREDLFSARFRQFIRKLERPAEPLTVGNLLGQENRGSRH